MKRKSVNTRYFVLTALASAILLSQSVYALQELQDNALSQVNGQDGLYIQTEYKQMDFDQLYWQDKAGTPTAGINEPDLRATANGVQIRKNTTYKDGNYKLGTNYKIQTGTTGSTVGLDFEIETMPSTISVKGFKVCNETAGTCDPQIGNVAIQTDSPQYIHFQTKNGLFDPNSQSDLRLSLQNLNMYIGLSNNVTNYYNQLILKNFNFNFLGKGVMYVDPTKGLMLQTNSVKDVNGVDVSPASLNQTPNDTHGYIDFTRVPIPNINASQSANATYKDTDGIATSSGLNIELMTKKAAYVDPTNPVYTLATDTSTSDNAAKGLIRVGASGRMVNSYLQIRGVDTKNQNQAKNILGYATNTDNGDPSTTTNTNGTGTVLGSTGIGVRLHGEFTNDGDGMLGAQLGTAGDPTTLEIGGAGANTFGFEFSRLSPLMSNSLQRAYFDSGDVYLGLASTRHLLLPENTVLNNARLGGASGTLTTAADYKQQIADTITPNSLVVAIRGSDFQTVSKRGRFTSSAGVSLTNTIGKDDGKTNSWGLGLPFYNLNSNIAVYSTKYTGEVFGLNNTTNAVTKANVTNTDRLGLAIGLSVQGRNDDGTKTTSIMVVDASRNYYIGLRNIDMLLRGYGSMGFENGNVNVTLKDLLMVMAAEIAGGYLPSYKDPTKTGTDLNVLSNINNPFNAKDDVLFGLKLKMLGDMNFSLVPNNEITANNNAVLSIVGRYLLKEGAIQLSDPVDESMIGLDNISGLIQFNNAIAIQKDTVSFNYGFTINPDREAENVLRVRDLNLYPKLTETATATTGQRLGEMVMTGGRINANMAITPRNGAFQLK
ncbi:hypothetical protein QTA56_06375 [Acinetobacter sp. VNH17]|uniref:DUF6160 domain-containing protein n=1 Tax=Acinetobacter thutiue TaxID=2998078 RepID=A0ABT7WMF2_9GAMM|nr:DUF6160 family protein [Acinetobacter thutiue]MCY6411765.1 hypothetical protein [Acinetobacter thutiue]MDN0013867.1 hypothetical protein [Acinetobacter thutiue]